ncbi:MAG: formate dehydrogenase accessory sulfurtransferase FdhD [Candidatus Brocadiia bacterium]
MTDQVPILRLRDGRREETRDTVVREATVSLVVGGRPLLRLQCLPQGLDDLAVGLLATSGLLGPGEPVPDVEHEPASGEVRVDFSPPEKRIEGLRRSLTLGSGCGAALSPAGEFDPLGCTRRVDTAFAAGPETIAAAVRAFVQRSELFRATGGVHGAAIAAGDRLVAFAEDIGRHNAFDKAVGACRRRGIELIDKLALVTGRLSLELVAKALPVSLPVLVSRGAPTSAGVRLAEDANLTLVGFARAGRMNVYTAPWRIP